MKIPASLLLGALAPIPPPTATGPPGMMHGTLDQGQVEEDGGKAVQKRPLDKKET
jgi:hypothetical protein